MSCLIVAELLRYWTVEKCHKRCIANGETNDVRQCSGYMYSVATEDTERGLAHLSDNNNNSLFHIFVYLALSER